MKKIILLFSLIAAISFMPTQADAQYQEGQIDANLGIGLSPYYAAFSIPITASVEYGVTDNISVGGLIGYMSFRHNYGSLYGGRSNGWRYTYFMFGARGAYHFNIDPEFDLYAGLLLGYQGGSVKYTGKDNFYSSIYYTEPTVSGRVLFGVYGGARYHFNESFGVYGELGYGITLLSVGITLKF